VEDASVEILKGVPLFSELDRKALKRVAQAMARRTFSAGDVIAAEGEPGVGFFVISDGRATVTVLGKEVAKLGPGDHVGEMALIAETPRLATVTADTDLVCYAMTSWDFRRLAESNAALSWALLVSTMRRVRNLEQVRSAAGTQI
jgi:CRP-like cAMP-binding protein